MEEPQPSADPSRARRHYGVNAASFYATRYESAESHAIAVRLIEYLAEASLQPSQRLDMRRTPPDTPEINLLVAVAEIAYADLRLGPYGKHRANYLTALEYFRDIESRDTFSFATVCELFGIDPAAASRAAIRRASDGIPIRRRTAVITLNTRVHDFESDREANVEYMRTYARKQASQKREDVEARRAETREMNPFASVQFTDEEVREIRRRVAQGQSRRSVAARYRVAPKTINAVIKGNTYKGVQ